MMPSPTRRWGLVSASSCCSVGFSSQKTTSRSGWCGSTGRRPSHGLSARWLSTSSSLRTTTLSSAYVCVPGPCMHSVHRCCCRRVFGLAIATSLPSTCRPTKTGCGVPWRTWPLRTSCCPCSPLLLSKRCVNCVLQLCLVCLCVCGCFRARVYHGSFPHAVSDAVL